MRHLLNGAGREQPAPEAIRREAIGFELIAAAVAAEFEEPWDDLKNRRGHPARLLSRRSLAIVCAGAILRSN
jgi:hypothetical protein